MLYRTKYSRWLDASKGLGLDVKMRKGRRRATAPTIWLGVWLTADPLSAVAAPADADAPPLLGKVTVSGERGIASRWEDAPATGSRLGLTLREVPAAVEVLTQSQLSERGLRGSVDALNAVAGVTAGQLASSPGMTSMRGFTGGAISLMYDGIRQTNAPLITRDFDTWSFERIEVLKGPASVLYGEGALAGAINLVPKRPHFEGAQFQGLMSWGRFGSQRYAIDANRTFDDSLALRAVASYQRSDGYVDDTRNRTFAGTLSARYRPDETLDLDIALDHYEDDFDTSYWGTPLLPAAVAREPSGRVRADDGRVLDRSIRYRNYNVANGVQTSRADWLRVRAALALGQGLRFVNELAYYDGHRRWRNAETYRYRATTGLLDRGLSRIEHEQQYWVERATLVYDTTIGGRRNRFSAGVEFSENDFLNLRRFGTTTSVDPFVPQRGRFPADEAGTGFMLPGNRADFDSTTRVASAFFENAWNLTPRWLLLAGLRYDRIELDRLNIDYNNGQRTRYGRRYEPVSWRMGAVFDLAPRTQLYAQYSRAVAPVGSLPLLSQANARFDLTRGHAVDAGWKSSFWRGRAELSLSGYRIEQDDIITRDPLNSAVSVQGGRQSSRGVEVSASVAIARGWRVEGSLARVNARFDRLLDAGGADRAGNTPPHVPETVAQLFATYDFQTLPVSATVGARHAGAFFTDNANTIRVGSHTVVDAGVAYRLPFGEIALRGRNLFDALYADWSGGAADQIVLAAPRSFELSFKVDL